MANWPPLRSPASNLAEGGKSPELEGKSPELPPELALRIAALGGKANHGEVIQAIVALLKWRELSLAELAEYLNRSPDHIRKTYLKQLIDADVVSLSIPATPNDPRQTYRAVRPNRPQEQ